VITVHLILNAHIDPVWLWPWQAGLDEIIATCRSACDRLDANPDVIFTRGEAWAYRMVEEIDPELFARIRGHVAAGRWEIVGGWWIQPDCNQPSGNGLEMQIALGRDYFQSRFGQFPRIAYNVDTFGHAASLPGIMRRFGQDRYVMMRPQEHELSLPARLFRWCGFEGEEEVVVFRIARHYGTGKVREEHILTALEGLPEGISHTMCFIGLGDHGGGPTERQIAWCREHADSISGCRLMFSSPSRFFECVAGETGRLPLVTGELQHHAVGCYSVTRSLKVGVRKAEHLLAQAELADGDAAKLTAAWEAVCFNQFHDTLGGTCIPSAYPALEDQLGGARAAADEVVQTTLRKHLAQLPGDERQRLALWNLSDRNWRGTVALAPWTEAKWEDTWRIVDADGTNVPYQLMQAEAATRFPPQVLLPVDIASGKLASLFIERHAQTEMPTVAFSSDLLADEQGLASPHARIVFEPETTLHWSDDFAIAPRLELNDDSTDTWAHGVGRIGMTVTARAKWDEARIVDRGPLMVSAVQHGTIGDSLLFAEWRLYAGDPAVELLLNIDWRARLHALKLVLPLPQNLKSHTDGIPGRALVRAPEPRERPVRDFSLLHLEDGRDFGIVCPDVFALEADAQAVSLTLLRSPFMAHHDPAKAEDTPRATLADQGLHAFRFRFIPGPTVEILEDRAMAWNRPLVTADWTRGMQARSAL
jgi:alpha-mannosidase